MIIHDHPTVKFTPQTIMDIQLNYDQILTVTLPDGQTIEIDARTRAETDISVINPHGDCYESLSFPEWQDDEPDPSLSAAERNPNMLR